jgi:transglutaminase-like putative cysteine protease
MTLKANARPVKRWWDPWIAMFSVAAVVLIGARLWATEWTSNLHTLMFLAFFAGAAGLALGVAQFTPLTTAIFSFVYGGYFTFWLFGTTIEENLTWHDRIVNVLGWRLQNAVLQFFRGETVTDPILFLTLMAILIWLISFLTTFFIVRKGVVWPVLVTLIVSLFIIAHYDQNSPYNTSFLMILLFFTFILVGRVSFLRNKQNWQAEGINTSTGAQNDLMRTLFVMAAILVLIAALIPLTTPAITRYSKFWDVVTTPFEKLNEELYTLFVADNPTKGIQSVYFGDSLGLGTGTPINGEVVMTITPEDVEPSGHRNYWRTRSYDTYLDSNWSSADDPEAEKILPEDFDIAYPEWAVGRTITYTVTNQLDRMINLYAPGVPIQVDRQIEAVLQPLNETETDLIALIAEPNLRKADTYQVTSRVVIPTAEELRASSTDYPDWLQPYLELPPDFSPDIIALASKITEGLDTNFDKTQAVTRYLRYTIEYTRTLPPVPEGVDPLEWFLFDSQTGFCNYYATSEILMLRSLGIPARLSVGYAEGEYDSETNSYTVRKQDSHAWPEVYFVGYGWTIFEPTRSLEMVIYPSSTSDPSYAAILPLENDNQVEAMLDNPSEDVLPRDRERDVTNQETGPSFSDFTTDMIEDEASSTPITKTAIIIGGIMLFVGLVIFIRPGTIKRGFDSLPIRLEKSFAKRKKQVPAWLRKWSNSVQLSSTDRAYLQIGRSIKRLGAVPTPSQTPLELGNTLVELLPQSQEAIDLILNEYLLEKFSDHIVDVDYAKSAARQIRRMTTRALFKEIFHKKEAEELENL